MQCGRIKTPLRQGCEEEGTCFNSYLRHGPRLLHPVWSKAEVCFGGSGEGEGDVRWRVHLQACFNNSDHSMDRRLLPCPLTGLSHSQPCLAPAGKPGEAPVQQVQLTSLALFSGWNLLILLKSMFSYTHWVKLIAVGAQNHRTKSGLIHKGEFSIGLKKPCSQRQRNHGHFKVGPSNPL